MIRCVLVVLALAAVTPAVALTPEQIGSLASSDSGPRMEALNAIAASGDERAIAFLQALADGNVQTSASAKKIVVMADGKGTDAITGKPIDKLPEDLDEVVANNVFRRELAAAIATLKLTSTDRATRFAAAKTLQDETESDRLPLVERAIAKEADAQIKQLLERVRANLQLNSKDKAVRLAAITSLASSVNPGTKTILLEMLAKKGGEFAEPDA
ncbi:MAG: urea ABC transporter permease subunit UrtB, partial [Betaproteobacteria bacterium]